ncbi:MAG: hypothetical protein IT215_06920 [Chitinophagaceae bacterium]|jgi:hypothetical protein|nr:hypothetical protein [Chitinophagaceae bacterium]
MKKICLYLFASFIFTYVEHSHAYEKCIIVDIEDFQEINQLKASLKELDLTLAPPQKPVTPQSKAQEQIRKDIEKANAMITEIDLINDTQVMMCVKSADVDQNSSGWDLKGDIGLKLARFIDLINFSSSYNASSSTTRNYYTCRNTKTGELFYGTMDEVIDWYNDFLETN